MDASEHGLSDQKRATVDKWGATSGWAFNAPLGLLFLPTAPETVLSMLPAPENELTVIKCRATAVDAITPFTEHLMQCSEGFTPFKNSVLYMAVPIIPHPC